MGKCPYCSTEVHLKDFYEFSKEETKKGKTRLTLSGFKGESSYTAPWIKMWVCPSCDTILGFTESFSR